MNAMSAARLASSTLHCVAPSREWPNTDIISDRAATASGMKGRDVKQPFRRYTNIPALLYLRKERKITLLDPASWDDKNDSYFLLLYREEKNLQSVLALCFTPAFETYHHLRLFAEGSSGVCISFNQEGLLKAVKKQVGVTARSVRYLTLPDIRAMRMKTGSLPFLKRSAFEDEREFRIIYESFTEKYDTIDIAIPLSCIDRITLSPGFQRRFPTTSRA